MTTRLQQALADWPTWPLPLTAPPRVREPLEAGRTNQNFRLSAPGVGDDLLLRLHREDGERLGIDRQRELEVSRLAAEAGIGRMIWHLDVAGRYSIHPYLDARVWGPADFADGSQRDRLWPLVDALESLDTGHARRHYGDYLDRYWRQLEASDAIDAGLERRWRVFRSELQVFDQAGWRAGLVHHDLIPANVLDRGDCLVLIDWEYAAMGHPDIDRWSIEAGTIREPFVAELMGWINRLWERLLLCQ